MSDILRTMHAQIGRSTVLATSGGRVQTINGTTLRLPVHYGYAVEVEYLPGSDLYEVRRTFTRGINVSVKGMVTGLFADQLPEMVYRAGCFRDPFGAEHKEMIR